MPYSVQEDRGQMPNIKSAIKRVKQEEKRHAHNRAVKSTVKTFITSAQKAIAAAPAKAETQETIKKAISELDKAVTKGVLHKNNAARRKSRLMAKLNAKSA